MKNQYFGDVRDLFKFDLIEYILKSNNEVGNFLYIPMLTKPDNKKHGKKRDYCKGKAGNKNYSLMRFLDENKNNGIKSLKDYEVFKRRIIIYKEDEFFCRENKNKLADYFTQARGLLYNNNFLIFVDPDIGLQVKNNKEKHILYDEARVIYKNMSSSSILMIYQHRPQGLKTIDCIRNTKEELDKIGQNCAITDKEIVFFFLTKNTERIKDVHRMLMAYHENYPQTTMER